MNLTRIIGITVTLTGLLSWSPVGTLYSQVHDLDALLDSLDSETYIAKEIRLQEVEVLGKSDPKQAFLLRYYKTNNLSTTEDVLSRLSGMSVIRRGNYAWEPVRHGMSSSQINVSVDGMQIFGACTDKMDPVTSYVEPNNLESIQLNEHDQAFEYGSNIGGGIDLTLKKPVFNSFHATAGARYETVSNGFSNLLSFNKGSEKLAVRVSAAYRVNNDYRSGGGEVIENSGFNKFNVSTGVAYLLGKNRLLSADFLMDDAWDIGYPALPMDVEYARARIAGLTYTQYKPLPGFSELEAKLYYNQINHRMDDSQREDIPMHMDMPGETRTTGGYVKLSSEESCNHDYSLKMDGYWTQAYAEMTMFPDEGPAMFMLTWPDVDRMVGGVVFSDAFRFCGKTSLSGSVRMDVSQTQMNSELGNRQLSVFGFEDYRDPVRVLPNLNFQLTQKLGRHTLRFGVGYSQRLPSTAEQFGFYLYNAYDGFDYIGIPDISNEKSISVSFSTGFTKGKLEWKNDLTGYWFQDYILGLIDPNLEAMTIGANGVKVYENLNSARILALDSRLIYNFNDHFNSLVSLKYTYGAEDSGNPLPLMPPLKTSLGFRYSDPRNSVQLDAEFAARQGRVNTDFGETETPGYELVNLRYFRNIMIGKNKMEAGFGIENLFDANYQEHLDWGELPRPGRNFQFNLNFYLL